MTSFHQLKGSEGGGEGEEVMMDWPAGEAVLE